MNLTHSDWLRLAALRDRFLAGARDTYWTPRDLALYDATFAQRIGWKWDAVLRSLDSAGWRPKSGRMLDWGCGTGIASRTVAAWSGIRDADVCDRASSAAEFASRSLDKMGIRSRPVPLPEAPLPPGTLLVVSHVAGELDDAGLGELSRLAASASEVLWVEPGALAVSRRLTGVRSALLSSGKRLAAPCTHRLGCPMAGRESDWCHFFASAPPEAFQSPFWREFSTRLGIDLRSLPYSFLAADADFDPCLPANAERLIGRPRERKAHLDLLCCGAEGLRSRMLQKRDAPEAYRKLVKQGGGGAFAWTLDEKGRIRSARELG